MIREPLAPETVERMRLDFALWPAILHPAILDLIKSHELLRGLRADDAEPLTAVWANERCAEAFVRNIRGAYRVYCDDLHNRHGYVTLYGDATRGEFRSLCDALRIEMLESANSLN